MAFLGLAAILGLFGLLTAKPGQQPSAPQGPPSSTKAHPGEVWTLRMHLEDPGHTITDASKRDLIEMLGSAMMQQGIASKVEGKWMDDSTLAMVVKYAKETELHPGTSFTDPGGRSLTLTYAVQSPLN